MEEADKIVGEMKSKNDFCVMYSKGVSIGSFNVAKGDFTWE